MNADYREAPRNLGDVLADARWDIKWMLAGGARRVLARACGNLSPDNEMLARRAGVDVEELKRGS